MNNKSRILYIPLIRDTIKLVTSNFVMYFLPFIVTPVLSRLYAPSFFGEWGVFSSTYQIVNVILFLCFDYTIVKVTKDELTESCVTSFIISMLVTALADLVFLIGSVFNIGYFTNFPSKTCLFILLLLSSITSIIQNLANRWKQYWSLSLSNIIVGVSQALFRILFAYICIFNNGLIGGTVVAQLIGALFLVFYVFKKQSSTIGKTKFKKIWAFVKKYKNFPLYDAPATLLTFATFNLTIIITSLYYNKSEVGCLSLVHQLLLLPISLLGGAMGRVYYQQITCEDASEEYIINVSSNMLRIVTAISILPVLFLSLGGDYLIDIFLGSKWIGAGHIAICLSIWSIPNILTQPLLPLLRKKNKQNYMLIFNILNFSFAILFLLASCILGLAICETLFFYAVASAIANYCLFVCILRISKVNYFKHNKALLFAHVLTMVLLIYRLSSIL